MKNSRILLLLYLISLSVFAQTPDTIYVPDDNLRYFLVNHDLDHGTDYGIIDNGDSTIGVLNLENVDTLIIGDVPGSSPKNTIGIKDFLYLEYLQLIHFVGSDLQFNNHSKINSIVVDGGYTDKISISQCNEFNKIHFFKNNTVKLFINNCESFSRFTLDDSGVDTANFNNCPNLYGVSFESNEGIDELTLTNCSNLNSISSEGNINNLIIENCLAITTLKLTPVYGVGVQNLIYDTLKNIQNLSINKAPTGIGNVSNNMNFPRLKHLNFGEIGYSSPSNLLTEIDLSICDSLQYIALMENLLTRLDISNCKNVGTLLTILNPLPIIYISESFNPTQVEKDYYTQLAVLRDTVSNPIVYATQTGAYELGQTGAIVNIVTYNGGEGTLLANTQSDPTIVGSLPVGIKTIRSEKYWVIEESELSDYEYNLILDLSSIDSLDIDSCEVLFRQNDTRPWIRVTDLADTVETVAHFKIINGLTQFGEFAVSDNTEPVSVEKEEEIIPEEYSLEQNYPNPFNPSTTINFALPRRSHVKLTVFNNRGELVSEMVNGDLLAGYHSVSFDGTLISSGVYYYQLRAESSEGNFVQTRKLVLLK